MSISVRHELESDSEDTGGSLGARVRDRNVGTVRQLVADLRVEDYYRRMYGRYGPLGEPTSDLRETADGYVREFELGDMKLLTNDLTPFPAVRWDALVEYVGLRCNEPNESGDEPYAVFSVVNLNPMYNGEDELVATRLVGPYPDVGDGEVVGDTQSMWQGLVGGTGLKVHVAVFEEDEGDPEEVRAEIEEKVREYGKKAVQAFAEAYGAGEAQAQQIAGNELVTWGLRILSLGIVEILDLGDDAVGDKSVEIPVSTVRRYDNDEAFQQSLQRTTEGLQYQYKLDVEQEDEGAYSLYFRVRSRQIPAIVEFPKMLPE